MGELVPAGTYQARAVAHFFGKTSQQEKEFLEITCELVGDGKFKGTRLKWNGWFNKQENAERSMKSLAIAGWDCESDPIDAKGLGTTVFDVVVEIEAERDGGADENGDPIIYPARNRIAWINEQGSGSLGREMTAAEKSTVSTNLRQLAAKMGLKPIAKASQQASAAQAATGTNGPAPTTASGKPLPI